MHVANTLSNELVNAVLNILLFSAIPFAWYLLKQRSASGFVSWLGIYRAKIVSPVATVVTIICAYLVTLSANIAVIMSGNSGRSPAGTSDLTTAVIAIYLVLYGLKTGVAEEVFFRGFIAKRLIQRLGFARGNAVQAVVFALPHYVIGGPASAIDIVVRITNAFILGWVFGLIMERKSNGSIVPVMISHILINMTSSLVLNAILTVKGF